MKLPLSLLAAACALAAGSFAHANEKVEIIYSASAKKNPFASAAGATGSLASRGTVLPAVKAQHDAFVYRSEGLATARHDEISSRAIMFHVTFERPGEIRPGHSLVR